MRRPNRNTWQVLIDWSTQTTVYQFDDETDARDFMETAPRAGGSLSLTYGPVRTETVAASTLRDDDVLADGTRIARLYFGRTKVRATGFSADYSRSIRRAYDPHQNVLIEQRSTR